MTTTRLLAEQILGIENLMKLDVAGIGVFSRDRQRAKQAFFRAVTAENQALHGIIADTLATLPFRQRLRLMHRALAIPSVECRCTHEDIVRRRLRRMVRAKRFVVHAKHPAAGIGPDAEGSESGSVDEHHGVVASAWRATDSSPNLSQKPGQMARFWSRLRVFPFGVQHNLSNLPAELREFFLRGVRELKRQRADAGVQ
ncbi:hypothetical protein DesfrDRAFT_0036 [Solidesulfovibrio fructosivorans JJ]]|uniref:Uncharacterized protein n=1 Tax=Solidesulfovibrio fructosivorans JJ] TaxID=596151 RepID=E1JQY7_SOLFR|nr:hypothetical protein DesfrDRAFT_0036 [Solidesulfovibrio fructosivorans JJ]]